MVIKFSIGGISFNLVLSSPEKRASVISTKFFPRNESENSPESQDAIIELKDFSGTLFITQLSTQPFKEKEVSKKFSNECTASEVKENLEGVEENENLANNEGKYGQSKKNNNNLKELKDKMNPIEETSADGTSFTTGKVESTFEAANILAVADNQDVLKCVKNKSIESVTFKMIENTHEKAIEIVNDMEMEMISEKNILSSQEKAVENIRNFNNISEKKNSLVTHDYNSCFESGRRNSLTSFYSSFEDEYDVGETEESKLEFKESISSQQVLNLPRGFLPRISNYAEDIEQEKNSRKERVFFKNEPKNIPYLKSIHARETRKYTELHLLCGSSKSTLADFRKTIELSPRDVTITDSQGRLPIHVLAENTSLIFGTRSEEVQHIIELIINQYPEAVLVCDGNGCIPFLGAIKHWISDVHDSLRMPSNLTLLRNLQDEVEDEVKIPTVVHSDPLVEWSFKMLSKIFNRLESFNQLLEFNSIKRSSSPASQFLDKISVLPLLFKTCYLINDDALRFRILGLPFMKRCLVKAHTVGNWIVALLADETCACRAIEYFEDLSNLTIRDALGISTRPRLSDVAMWKKLRHEVILHISQMDSILTTIFLLNFQEKKRGSLTYAIQSVLEISMRNASLAASLVFDITMNLLLLAGFSEQISLLSFVSNDILLTKSPILLTSLICIYLFIRENVASFIIHRSFHKAYRRYSRFWDLIELASIIAVFGANMRLLFFAGSISYWVLGIAKVLIWLRLISILKRMNVNLAMFVFSIGRILTSMKWFLIVLAIVMFMFADTMHLILRKERLCEGVDEMSLLSDYCSPNLATGFLRAYSIIVGADEGLDNFRSAPLVVFAWFLYTFFGVIILLNVLIALVNDAYEKTNVKRYSLLGRVRIPLLAKHAFLVRFMSKVCKYKGRSFYLILSGVISFLLLYCLSFSFAVLSLGYLKEVSIPSGIFIVLSSILFSISIVSFIVAMKYLLQIEFWHSQRPPWFVEKLMNMASSLASFSEEGFDHLSYDLKEKDLLPEIKDLLDKFESRLKRELKEEFKVSRTLA